MENVMKGRKEKLEGRVRGNKKKLIKNYEERQKT